MENSATHFLMQEIDALFPGKIFLTLEDVANLLSCSPKVIYNWTKRSNPIRRPPRLLVGKELRFPKREFVRWLSEEQTGKEANS